MKILIFLIPMFLFASCEGYDSKLKIINNSAVDLYVIAYDTSSLTDYPNKVLDFDLVKKNKSINLMRFGANNSAWSGYVKTARNKKLNLFAIEKTVVDSTERDSVVRYKKYYKQLSYSLKELEKMKWHVIIR